jgi:hypothetical protein
MVHGRFLVEKGSGMKRNPRSAAYERETDLITATKELSMVRGRFLVENRSILRRKPRSTLYKSGADLTDVLVKSILKSCLLCSSIYIMIYSMYMDNVYLGWSCCN